MTKTAKWLEDESWHRIRNRMLLSPAFRALSSMATKILFATLSELGRHSGKDNGHLIFTNRDFARHGISRNAIKPGLLELEGVGFINFKRGRPGTKGYGVARRIRLTFLPILDADRNEVEPPTDEWTKFSTTKEAKMAAKAARRKGQNSNFRSRNETTSVVVSNVDHITNGHNRQLSAQVIEKPEVGSHEMRPLSTSTLTNSPMGHTPRSAPVPPPPMWSTPTVTSVTGAERDAILAALAMTETCRPSAEGAGRYATASPTPEWHGSGAKGRYRLAAGAMTEHHMPFADDGDGGGCVTGGEGVGGVSTREAA